MEDMVRGGGGQDARHDKRGEGKMQDMVRGGGQDARYGNIW